MLIMATSTVLTTAGMMTTAYELKQLSRVRRREELEARKNTTSYLHKTDSSRNCLAFLEYFFGHYKQANIQPNVHPVMNEW